MAAQGHDLTDDWSKPMPISLLVWVRSFIEPDVLKTMYRLTIPLQPIYLINLLWKLGLGFRLDSELHYFSIFHGK